MITPEIIEINQKQLVGIHQKMNLMENNTAELWQQFSPRIKEIENTSSTFKYSLQIYPENYFNTFNPQTGFVKWAAVEVNEWDKIPSGMEVLTVKKGKYAVFHYKGSSTDQSIFQFIYGQWIPNSIYTLDNRPHFEVLGENYKNNNPNSEEDIFIPIRLKSD